MSDFGVFHKSGYGIELDWDHEDQEFDLLVHPRTYRRSRRRESVVYILDAKRARRAAQRDAQTAFGDTELDEARKETWGRIGLTIICGLIIAVIGGAIHFVVSGPFPLAVGAFGMLLVVVALWYGRRLGRIAEYFDAPPPQIIGRAA